MIIFKTNKLEERKMLEDKGLQCKEVIGKDSVDFVFEVEEDVNINVILNPVGPGEPNDNIPKSKVKDKAKGKNKGKK